MTPEFTLLLSLLGLSVVGANANNCLSSTGTRESGFKECCPSSSTSGNEPLGAASFQYSCGKWARPYDSSGQRADTARACASLCASDSSCRAASWFYLQSRCYLTTTDKYSQYPSANALLIEKTQDSPDVPSPGCADQVAAAKEQGRKDKEASEKVLARKCDEEKDVLRKSCEGGNLKAEERCRSDKEGLKAQCEREKEMLKSSCQDSAMEQCKSDKATLETAKSQCLGEKSDLEQQLRKCRDLKGSGSKPDVSKSPSHEACNSASWGQMCPPSNCPEHFSIDGVEYIRKCGVATGGTAAAPLSASSPAECLKSACNYRSDCLGIGWISTLNVCVIHYRAPGAVMFHLSNPMHHAIVKKNI